MNCDQCQAPIPDGEAHERLGRTLCEDCYMEALSPVRTCDPWAVHSAKTFERQSGGRSALTSVQEGILRILEESGGLELKDLLARMEGRLTLKELENEFAALRHMERVRAEKRGAKVVLRLW